jgi:hypothetical protein
MASAEEREATFLVRELKGVLHRHAQQTRDWALANYPLMSPALFRSLDAEPPLRREESARETFVAQ